MPFVFNVESARLNSGVRLLSALDELIAMLQIPVTYYPPVVFFSCK
jgi:hypothetical protein